MKVYILSSEWNYPCESGNEIIPEVITDIKLARFRAMTLVDEERFNFMNKIDEVCCVNEYKTIDNKSKAIFCNTLASSKDKSLNYSIYVNEYEMSINDIAYGIKRVLQKINIPVYNEANVYIDKFTTINWGCCGIDISDKQFAAMKKRYNCKDESELSYYITCNYQDGYDEDDDSLWFYESTCPGDRFYKNGKVL